MIRNDDLDEPDETFTLEIYDFVYATAGAKTRSTITIQDDDEVPVAPTEFTATLGNMEVALAWDAPGPDSGVTGHEYRYKTTGNYLENWTAIADSAVAGMNEASFTVTGLTNGTQYTFQLRAVSAAGNGDEAEADPVTPMLGICDRTAKIQEVILAALADVDDCAAVTVANLAGLTSLQVASQSIDSLKSGDFAGLTSMTLLNLASNSFTTLPADVFSDLTALTTLVLAGGELTLLPAGVFSGLTNLTGMNLSNNALESLPGAVFSDLTALSELRLNNNSLDSLPADVFSGLTALSDLHLNNNSLDSLPADVFSGLTALIELQLDDNALESLPGAVFSDLTALIELQLDDNALESLPDGVFSGLTALSRLTLEGNSTDPMELTVTVEKVGTNRVRAKVLAGAPFAVDIPVTPVDGTLEGSVTALGVATGEVDGSPLTVTRTAGTTAAVTVDVDLTTHPTLPTGHSGYIFVKATTGLPATILPAAGAPQNFTVAPGDTEVALAWDAPASDSGVTSHEYSYETTETSRDWTAITDSGVGGANEASFTVTMLTNELAHTFKLRAVSDTNSPEATALPVTPTPGICDRTQQVQDEILNRLSTVSACAAVTVADLASVRGWLWRQEHHVAEGGRLRRPDGGDEH